MTLSKRKKIVLLGYGTIGKCVLDLLLFDSQFIERRLRVKPISYDYHIIDMNLDGTQASFPKEARLNFYRWKLKKNNLKKLFHNVGLGPGDVVIDLTNGTETKTIMKTVVGTFHSHYIGTAIEGWNGYMYPMPEMIKNMEKLQSQFPAGAPTAIMTHGMNPGMVSHYALAALRYLKPNERRAVTKIHVTEIDTQRYASRSHRKPVVAVPKLTVNRPRMAKNIISTWGPQNFVDEMNAVPIYIRKSRSRKERRRAFRTNMSSMIFDPKTKKLVPYTGHVVTHEEAFTINNYLKKTYPEAKADVAFIYRPTLPSMQTLMSSGPPMRHGERKGLLIKGPGITGYDVVGVYVENAATLRRIWVGNVCKAGYAANPSIARRHHNATTMQVAAGVMAGLAVIWRSPRLGVIFPEDIPERLRPWLLNVSERYYGKIVKIITP